MNFVQMVSVFFTVGIIILIFGIRYLRNKENMALIEKNKDLNRSIKPETLLLYGIIFIGISLGILLGAVLNNFLLKNSSPLVFVFSIILFLGISFIYAFNVIKKNGQ